MRSFLSENVVKWQPRRLISKPSTHIKTVKLANETRIKKSVA